MMCVQKSGWGSQCHQVTASFTWWVTGCGCAGAMFFFLEFAIWVWCPAFMPSNCQGWKGLYQQTLLWQGNFSTRHLLHSLCSCVLDSFLSCTRPNAASASRHQVWSDYAGFPIPFFWSGRPGCFVMCFSVPPSSPPSSQLLVPTAWDTNTLTSGGLVKSTSSKNQLQGSRKMFLLYVKFWCVILSSKLVSDQNFFNCSPSGENPAFWDPPARANWRLDRSIQVS